MHFCRVRRNDDVGHVGEPCLAGVRQNTITKIFPSAFRSFKCQLSSDDAHGEGDR